ncbi:MAG: chromate reductase [Planctomycetota bacterium]|jgi:chromate reductase
MARRVIAFAASSSRTSINKSLVIYASDLLPDAEVELLDLNDYELPLFSVDREAELGQPELARNFFNKISNCDGIIISFAEHNGNYSAAYKNWYDWMSRIDSRVYQQKPMVVLATSPGKRGGLGVLEIALSQIPRFGGLVKASLSLPGFYDYFDSDKREVRDPKIRSQLLTTVNKLFENNE